jgi:putative flavoprotein involved in K+ transport
MEAIVVGAGQAGVATSQALAQRGVDHVVLERGLIGDTWRTRRWDTFRMVTLNWMNALPGQSVDSPDGFATAPDFADRLAAYVHSNGLPVREHAPVVSARPAPDGFVVDSAEATFRARTIVVASGFQWHPRIPADGTSLPTSVLSLHSSAYRRPELLPDGAVVVVGSAQSGTQIALDLALAGRPVFLCTSRARRLPRRHRGQDSFRWWKTIGILDQRPDDLADPAVMRLPQPVLSGAEGGRSISYHQLARAGVTLLGRLVHIDRGTLVLADDRDDNIAYAETAAAAFRREIDAYIETRGLTAPPPEPDPADDTHALPLAPQTLDLAAIGVGTVLWCTGYVPHLPWLTVPDSHPGVHIVGRPWLTRRSSGILHGMPVDAARVAQAIAGGGRTVPAAANQRFTQ